MLHNQNLPSFNLVLASQSPRRHELLKLAGIPHSVRPANIPEVLAPGESARAYVERLSRQKAFALPIAHKEAILAADTTVVLTNQSVETLLEKPRDRDDAIRMLASLSGRTHDVLTGICLRLPHMSWSHVEGTEVTFAPLSPTEIESYVDSGEPFDKAGAYAIQGIASRFISSIHGCYFNVVGLPIHQVHLLLQKARQPQ